MSGTWSEYYHKTMCDNPLGVITNTDIEEAEVAPTFAILQKWFGHMEDGTASLHLPDPAFKPPWGRVELTEKLVNLLISEIDREMDIDALGSRGHYFGIDATPEFHRLEYPQRLALAQELMMVVHSEGQIKRVEKYLQERKARDATEKTRDDKKA